MKKKYIYNEKTKKKIVKKFGKWLLPKLCWKEANCIAIQFVGLGLYCRK